MFSLAMFTAAAVATGFRHAPTLEQMMV